MRKRRHQTRLREPGAGLVPRCLDPRTLGRCEYHAYIRMREEKKTAVGLLRRIMRLGTKNRLLWDATLLSFLDGHQTKAYAPTRHSRDRAAPIATFLACLCALTSPRGRHTTAAAILCSCVRSPDAGQTANVQGAKFLLSSVNNFLDFTRASQKRVPPRMATPGTSSPRRCPNCCLRRQRHVAHAARASNPPGSVPLHEIHQLSPVFTEAREPGPSAKGFVDLGHQTGNERRERERSRAGTRLPRAVLSGRSTVCADTRTRKAGLSAVHRHQLPTQAVARA